MNTKTSRYPYPKIIRDVESLRKKWKLPKLSKHQFILAKLRRTHFNKRQALQILKQNFEIKDKNIKRVDINKEFNKFSEKEKKYILENLVALELTRGCTGGCPFCVFGLKKGVTHIYTYASLKYFFTTYRKYLFKINPTMSLLKNFLIEKFGFYYSYLPIRPASERVSTLYWNGDPFNYLDKQKEKTYTFFDVYKLLVGDGCQGFSHYLSTSIPPGSQEQFILFWESIIQNWNNEKIRKPSLRISIGKHNIQRVEFTLKFLYKYLHSQDYKKTRIEKIFHNAGILNFTVRDMNDNTSVFPTGSLIKKADTFKDIISPVGAVDGTIISPHNIHTIITTIPSKKYPSGILEYSLKTGHIEDTIAKYCLLHNYSYYFMDLPPSIDKQLHITIVKKILAQKTIFYPLPKNINDLVYKKRGEPKKDFFVRTLNRYSLSLRHFIAFTAQLNETYIARKDKKMFFALASKRYKKIRSEIVFYCQQAKKLKDKDVKTSLSIMEFYLFLMKAIMYAIDTNKNEKIVTIVTSIFLKLKTKHALNKEKMALFLQKEAACSFRKDEILKKQIDRFN